MVFRKLNPKKKKKWPTVAKINRNLATNNKDIVFT